MGRGFRAGLAFAAGFEIVALSSCAPPSTPPPPATQSTATETLAQAPSPVANYGWNAAQSIASDLVLRNILVSQNVTGRVAVKLVITPDGTVRKASIVQSELPPDVSEAIVVHLLSVHFGAFSSGMPNHDLVFVAPIEFDR